MCNHFPTHFLPNSFFIRNSYFHALPVVAIGLSMISVKSLKSFHLAEPYLFYMNFTPIILLLSTLPLPHRESFRSVLQWYFRLLNTPSLIKRTEAAAIVSAQRTIQKELRERQNAVFKSKVKLVSVLTTMEVFSNIWWTIDVKTFLEIIIEARR